MLISGYARLLEIKKHQSCDMNASNRLECRTREVRIWLRLTLPLGTFTYREVAQTATDRDQAVPMIA